MHGQGLVTGSSVLFCLFFGGELGSMVVCTWNTIPIMLGGLAGVFDCFGPWWGGCIGLSGGLHVKRTILNAIPIMLGGSLCPL